MSNKELVEKAQETKHATWGKVEIVGSWIWVEFDRKPNLKTREYLKRNDFRWNDKRQVWQFAGTPCRYSNKPNAVIRWKYGVVVLDDDK